MQKGSSLSKNNVGSELTLFIRDTDKKVQVKALKVSALFAKIKIVFRTDVGDTPTPAC